MTTSTFLDTPDTDTPGLIDVSKSTLADVLEGVAIEEPRIRLGVIEPSESLTTILTEAERNFFASTKPSAFPPRSLIGI